MKKSFLLFSLLFLLAGFQAYSQNYEVRSVKEAAAVAESRNADIIRKVDPATGEVHYYRKAACPNSGQAVLMAVEFCAKSGEFIERASYGKVSCNKSVGKKTATAVVAPCTPEQRAACSAACAEACGKAGKARLVANNN